MDYIADPEALLRRKIKQISSLQLERLRHAETEVSNKLEEGLNSMYNLKMAEHVKQQAHE